MASQLIAQRSNDPRRVSAIQWQSGKEKEMGEETEGQSQIVGTRKVMEASFSEMSAQHKITTRPKNPDWIKRNKGREAARQVPAVSDSPHHTITIIT